MPVLNLGQVGFSLEFTAKLPPAAQKVLAKKYQGREDAVASFGLTPSWGNVPTILVADIRRAGGTVPEHWLETNEVYPLINGMALYIKPVYQMGYAASFSMKGVNLRTGDKELNQLTDNPCQSYWSGRAPSWIDGYVPSHGQAVRQFVPLRGDKAMQYDVSDAVGVAKDHPWKDGISVAFYLPRDTSKMTSSSSRYPFGDPSLEYLSVNKGSPQVYRGGVVKTAREPEEVGIGAGALMRQQHLDNSLVKASDFGLEPIVRLTSRIVWDDQWNEWAKMVGANQISISTIRQLEERQREYEAQIWARLGGPRKSTHVDDLLDIG